MKIVVVFTYPEAEKNFLEERRPKNLANFNNIVII
jgi:hypothetical protein